MCAPVIYVYIWAFFFRAGGRNPLIPSTIFGGWIFREYWGDEGNPPPYFEGARFIFEGFSSSFDDMVETIWILLKFWPFFAAGASLVRGAKIAISVSPAPLFHGGLPPPPLILGVGNLFLKVFGVWSDGLLHVVGAWRSKSKRDTTCDHPSPISQTYRPLPSHVPPVPSIEHCKREQYSSVTGGDFGGYPPRCMRYASVGSLPPF